MDSIQSAPGGGSAFIFDFSWLTDTRRILIVGSPVIVAAVVMLLLWLWWSQQTVHCFINLSTRGVGGSLRELVPRPFLSYWHSHGRPLAFKMEIEFRATVASIKQKKVHPPVKE